MRLNIELIEMGVEKLVSEQRFEEAATLQAQHLQALMLHSIAKELIHMNKHLKDIEYELTSIRKKP